MRWSKVRKLVEESFADSVRGRVKVHVTNADPRGVPFQDSCTRGWISVDGVVVAQFEPHYLAQFEPYYLRRLTLSLPRRGASREVISFVEARPEQTVPSGAVAGSFLDFTKACWEYLHSNLSESLHSGDPFTSSLAVLNAKVGRQRLQRLSSLNLHALTRWMLDFRMDAERDARLRTPVEH